MTDTNKIELADHMQVIKAIGCEQAFLPPSPVLNRVKIGVINSNYEAFPTFDINRLQIKFIF